MDSLQDGEWLNALRVAFASADGRDRRHEGGRPAVTIWMSIQKAHDDMQAGDVLINSGELLDASDNRSPYAYEQNPPDERDRYAHTVDKDMTIFKVVSEAGTDLGMINFFPVHTTSMKNDNHLVSSDNKGYAAHAYELDMNPGKLPGEGDFVAAFAQTNQGDVTPNVAGSRCNHTNDLCDHRNSTCPEDREDPSLCTGRGVTGDDFEDTKIIGERQYLKAKELYDSASERMYGAVDFRHMWVNMSQEVPGESGFCPPSMGYSFAAGATDGPGTPPFVQGMLEPLEDIDDIINMTFDRPQWLKDCQAPKPVLFPTGLIDPEWPWQPEIIPLQLFRIGDTVLIGAPAEVTTMAGRRIRDVVHNALVQNGYPATIRPIIVGMANSYSSYLVTEEEYSVQRYEGASTIFGPKSLEAYNNKYAQIAEAMAKDETVDPGPDPPNLRGYVDDALDPVVTDALQAGQSHGEVLVDVSTSYRQGDTVEFTFVAGNPRNSHDRKKRYLAVMRQNGADWDVAYTDAHWITKFIWTSSCHDDGEDEEYCDDMQYSNGTVTWDIPANQETGTYKIAHDGHARFSDNTVVPYSTESAEFQVEAFTGQIPVSKPSGRLPRKTPRDSYADTIAFINMYIGNVDSYIRDL